MSRSSRPKARGTPPPRPISCWAFSFAPIVSRNTREKKNGDYRGAAAVTIGVSDVEGVRHAAKAREALVEGVEIARDLVNEPANILFPVEFADRAASLSKLGVAIDVLDEKAMAKLGMGALLGVGQGSAHDSRLVVMRWNGAKGKARKSAPIAFIGKGVCFDTGGVSIKPAAGMEDMKGDMAGAACVVGLMHALASRKAKVNAIGAIGLVENMPSGEAMRPGDILTSMSGQTIEVINTDAEGRLVLADVLWYVQDKYKPALMVDLATLDGRDSCRARSGIRGVVLQQRRARQASDGCGRRQRRESLAHAARRGLRQADRFRNSPMSRTAPGAMAGRSPRRSFCSGSSMARPGPISTSPAPGWDRRPAKSISPGVLGGACVCSTGWWPIITKNEREEKAMLWRGAVAVIFLALAGAGAPAFAKSALTGCDAFVDKLRLAASDMQVEFTHSLVVSRAKTDVSVFDITTKVDVDATLTCHGDEFIRFEARIAEPASARAATNFDRFSAAAMRGAMGWDESRSENLMRGMTSDAREYLTLRGSAATSTSRARPKSMRPAASASA